ncbi:MAG: hypothetical protein LBF55_05065 [Prevotellaceae bacterium]|jgi:hypothetical protein|nr:hypothetical protein [Prevotellaceae bacterium]
MEKYTLRTFSEERKIKESKRFDTLVAGYEKFCAHLLSPQTRAIICLNRAILSGMVRSYFDDIERFKEYTGSERADRHKQAAYTIKWIAKLKPIQIKIDEKEDKVYETASKELLEVNARFAVYAGIVLFLDERVIPLVSKMVLEHLVYAAMFRGISGHQLAFSMYLMERVVDCYYRDPSKEFKM